MRIACIAAGFIVALAWTPAGAIGPTPGGVCNQSGFGKGDPLHDECVSRVFRERRSSFWRDQPPYLMTGVIAGVVSSGGGVIDVNARRPRSGIYRVDVDGEDFLLQLGSNQEATVRSAFKNDVRQRDVPLWRRAAEVGTGCSIERQVRDQDAMYFWLDCAVRPTGLDAAFQAEGPEPSTNRSIADEIEKLSNLRDRGLITGAEFEAAKAKILSQWLNVPEGSADPAPRPRL